MHNIRLEIEDSVFDKVIYFLQNLPEDEVKIIEEVKSKDYESRKSNSDIKAYANHSANLIEDWKECEEDEIWK
jgi:hypothetical protein